MNNFSNSPSPNRSNPFITLTGKSHNRMMNAAYGVAQKRVGNLTFNHTALIFPANSPPLIKGMSSRF